jgi:L-ascorbate metabolism protein UlaG (beta-lactamase superfamily)
MLLKVTGSLPSGSYLKVIQQSINYKNGAFQNLSPTPMKAEGITYWKMFREFFKSHPGRQPPVPLPYIKTDLNNLSGDLPVIIWFGHSSYLIHIGNTNILVDPVFSGHASPVSFMLKSFPGSDIYRVEDLPVIDHLVITHDHYDHLDYKTILQLKTNVKNIVCSLGVKSHLLFWGVAENIITELDWGQSLSLETNFTLTAAPARHFSGRGLKRCQSLWSSFILKTPTYNIYLGGDSGYDFHFKEIGKKYGPFDIAILESGQYNRMWPLIHMMPEETVQAAIDLHARALFPVHWGKFSLSMHPWDEPIKRIIKKIEDLPLILYAPMIGQPLTLDGNFAGSKWWEI